MTIRQIIVKIMRGLLPKKVHRYLKARYDFFDLNVHKAHTKVYGDIYLPIYNSHHEIDGTEPELYNADGTRLRSIFFRDNQFITSNPLLSKYFIFNRYNFALPVHLYTHSCMRQLVGNPKKRYGLLIEPRTVDEQDYKLLENHPELVEKFDRVFTFDERLLDKYPNASQFCFNAELRLYGRDEQQIKKDMEDHEKLKNISIVSSDKLMCDLHRLRYDWAKKFKNSGKVDTYGTFDGGKWVIPFDYLYDYRYSIVVENSIEPYWFTEKILNCFAMRTVPIYVGHPKMLERFNADGIIFVDPKDYGRIDEIIKQCGVADYEARKAAIEDNFNRVQVYGNAFDVLYEKYLKNDLAEMEK